MKRISLTDEGGDLQRALRLARDEDVLILRNGKPAGLLVGFKTEDDWLDYQLEHTPEFLADMAQAREEFRQGRGIPLEEMFAMIDEEERKASASKKRAV